MIRLYRNGSLHTNTHYTQSRNAVNINNMRKKYNNNLHSLMWYERQSLDLKSPLVAQFNCNAFFPSVGQHKRGRLRWQYAGKFLFGSIIQDVV